MYNNQLLLNSSVSPVYFDTTNIIYPIKTMTFNSLYTMFINILEIVNYVIINVGHPYYFLLTELYKMNGTQKFLIIFCFYNVIITIKLNKKYKKQIKRLKKKIETTEMLRNDNIDLIMDELSVLRNETNLKISTLDKKIKKNKQNVSYLECNEDN